MGTRLTDSEKKELVHRLNYVGGATNPLMVVGEATAAKLGRAPAPIRRRGEAGRVQAVRRFERWMRANPEADPRTQAPGHIWRSYIQEDMR
jgi:hypothetical protein